MTQPTEDIKLPELPSKAVVYRHMPDDYRWGDVRAYTDRQMRGYARAAVLADRERQRQNLPANWNHDSSLETWFPLTAEALRKLRAENAELRKDKARLDSGMILTRGHNGEGEFIERRYHRIDLRKAIDAAMVRESKHGN